MGTQLQSFPSFLCGYRVVGAMVSSFYGFVVFAGALMILVPRLLFEEGS